EDAVGEHDVAVPSAVPAVAHEDTVASRPVLRGQSVASVRQRERRGAVRTELRRVAAVPSGVGREPATSQVDAELLVDLAAALDEGHEPSRFSHALMCRSLSESACGLNRLDAMSMKSTAKV